MRGRLSFPVLVLAACSPSTARTPPAEPAADHAPHGHDEPAGEHHEGEGAGHGPNARHDGHGHGHHRFEDAEQWAEHFDDPSRDEWQKPEAVIDFIAPAPDARIADLGAGTGYFAVRLAQRVPRGQVFANDIEPDMVRYLGERARTEGLTNLTPVQGSPDDPAVPGDLDVAFMCDVYHHIEDPSAFFGAVVSRLAPQGRVVIVDFKKDAPDDAPGPPAAMRVSVDELVAELANVSLELVRADRTQLPYQYIVELKPGPRN